MPKTQKIEFQIGSIQGVVMERECVELFMRVNGQTVTAVNGMECFKAPEGIRSVMQAFVAEACRMLFPQKVMPCKKRKK